MSNTSHPPNLPIASVVLDVQALRQALLALLSDPEVVERLAAIRPAGNESARATPPTFMTAKEYAQHARMSLRSLDYARSHMTEGIHFSRNGRRTRYHVAAADEFLSKTARNEPPASIDHGDDLKELARQEASRRRTKLPVRRS